MVESGNHYSLHPTSILEAYNMFKHHHMLWMGIWVHPYTVITCAGGGQILEDWGKAELICAVVMVEVGGPVEKM